MIEDSTFPTSECSSAVINKIELSESNTSKPYALRHKERKRKLTRAERNRRTKKATSSLYQSTDDKSLFYHPSEVDLEFLEKKRTVLQKKQTILSKSRNRILENVRRGLNSTFHSVSQPIRNKSVFLSKTLTFDTSRLGLNSTLTRINHLALNRSTSLNKSHNSETLQHGYNTTLPATNLDLQGSTNRKQGGEENFTTFASNNENEQRSLSESEEFSTESDDCSLEQTEKEKCENSSENEKHNFAKLLTTWKKFTLNEERRKKESEKENKEEQTLPQKEGKCSDVISKFLHCKTWYSVLFYVFVLVITSLVALTVYKVCIYINEGDYQLVNMHHQGHTPNSMKPVNLNGTGERDKTNATGQFHNDKLKTIGSFKNESVKVSIRNETAEDGKLIGQNKTITISKKLTNHGSENLKHVPVHVSASLTHTSNNGVSGMDAVLNSSTITNEDSPSSPKNASAQSPTKEFSSPELPNTKDSSSFNAKIPKWFQDIFGAPNSMRSTTNKQGDDYLDINRLEKLLQPTASPYESFSPNFPLNLHPPAHKSTIFNPNIPHPRWNGERWVWETENEVKREKIPGMPNDVELMLPEDYTTMVPAIVSEPEKAPSATRHSIVTNTIQQTPLNPGPFSQRNLKPVLPETLTPVSSQRKALKPIVIQQTTPSPIAISRPVESQQRTQPAIMQREFIDTTSTTTTTTKQPFSISEADKISSVNIGNLSPSFHDDFNDQPFSVRITSPTQSASTLKSFSVNGITGDSFESNRIHSFDENTIQKALHAPKSDKYWTLDYNNLSPFIGDSNHIPTAVHDDDNNVLAQSPKMLSKDTLNYYTKNEDDDSVQEKDNDEVDEEDDDWMKGKDSEEDDDEEADSGDFYRLKSHRKRHRRKRKRKHKTKRRRKHRHRKRIHTTTTTTTKITTTTTTSTTPTTTTTTTTTAKPTTASQKTPPKEMTSELFLEKSILDDLKELRHHRMQSHVDDNSDEIFPDKVRWDGQQRKLVTASDVENFEEPGDDSMVDAVAHENDEAKKTNLEDGDEKEKEKSDLIHRLESYQDNVFLNRHKSRKLSDSDDDQAPSLTKKMMLEKLSNNIGDVVKTADENNYDSLLPTIIHHGKLDDKSDAAGDVDRGDDGRGEQKTYDAGETSDDNWTLLRPEFFNDDHFGHPSDTTIDNPTPDNLMTRESDYIQRHHSRKPAIVLKIDDNTNNNDGDTNVDTKDNDDDSEDNDDSDNDTPAADRRKHQLTDPREKYLLRIEKRIRSEEEKRKKKHKSRKEETKTYKVKSCVRIKTFKRRTFVKIIKGPTKRHGKIIYKMRACTKKSRTHAKCHYIDYKVLKGKLSLRKERHGRNKIYSVFACRDREESSFKRHSISSDDDNDDDEDDEREDGKSNDGEDTDETSSDKENKEDDDHDDESGNSSGDEDTDVEETDEKVKHRSHFNKKATRRVNNKLGDLMSMMKDMRKEMKKQEKGKINEKDLVKKVQQVIIKQTKKHSRKHKHHMRLSRHGEYASHHRHHMFGDEYLAKRHHHRHRYGEDDGDNVFSDGANDDNSFDEEKRRSRRRNHIEHSEDASNDEDSNYMERYRSPRRSFRDIQDEGNEYHHKHLKHKYYEDGTDEDSESGDDEDKEDEEEDDQPYHASFRYHRHHHRPYDDDGESDDSKPSPNGNFLPDAISREEETYRRENEGNLVPGSITREHIFNRNSENYLHNAEGVSMRNDGNSMSATNEGSNSANNIASVVAKILPAVVQSVASQNEMDEKRSAIPTVLPSIQPTKRHRIHTTVKRTTKHMTTPKRIRVVKTTRHVTHSEPKTRRTTQGMNLNMIVKGLKALGISPNDVNQKRSPTKRAIASSTRFFTSAKPHVVNLHDPTRMRVLCFGDSLTAGYYAHGKHSFPYCQRMQNILNIRSSIPVFTEAKGIVGEMTHKQMTHRLPLVLGNATAEYDWIIILGGTNDILHVKNFADDEEFLNQLETVWEPRITKDVEKLHETAYKYGAHTVLLTVPENSIEVWPDYKPLLKMRERINRSLRQFAFASKGKTVLCDLAKKLPRHSLGPEEEAKLWDDHLHMTPEGYTKMAGIVADCLKPYLPHNNGW